MQIAVLVSVFSASLAGLWGLLRESLNNGAQNRRHTEPDLPKWYLN